MHGSKGKNGQTFVQIIKRKPGNWVSFNIVVALGTVIFVSFTCHGTVGSMRKGRPTEMPENWGKIQSLLSIHILIFFRSTSCLQDLGL